MPSRRDLTLMGVLSVLFGVLAALTLLGGLSSDVLLVAPLVVLVVPLLGGRYLGEERLEQLRLARAADRPRPLRAPSAAPRRASELVALRGRLVAAVHASRPPPARLLHTA